MAEALTADIEDLMRESAAALERSDLAWVEEHTSRTEGTVAIGTDPDEYARDSGTTMQLMKDSTPDAEPQIRIVIDDVRAYEEGVVGWSDATGHFEHDGTSVPVRITDVVRRVDGMWRSVQTQPRSASPPHMFEPMFTAATIGSSGAAGGLRREARRRSGTRTRPGPPPAIVLVICEWT